MNIAGEKIGFTWYYHETFLQTSQCSRHNPLTANPLGARPQIHKRLPSSWFVRRRRICLQDRSSRRAEFSVSKLTGSMSDSRPDETMYSTHSSAVNGTLPWRDAYYYCKTEEGKVCLIDVLQKRLSLDPKEPDIPVFSFDRRFIQS